MSKLLKANEVLRFSPSSQGDAEESERLTFLLRAPSLYSRAQLTRAVRRQGGRETTVLDWLRVAERGLKEIGELANNGEVVEDYLAVVRNRRDRFLSAESGDARVAILLEQNEELEAAADLLRAHYPPLNDLEGNQAFYATCYGIEAARLFLVGWENFDAEFRTTKTGVPDEVLQQVDEGDLVEIGYYVQSLFRPTPKEAKNSDSPSHTGSTETTSISGATAKTSRRKTRCKAKPGTSRKSDSPN